MVFTADADFDAALAQSIPQELKDSYAKYWWGYAFLLLVHTLLRQIAGDIFGALSTFVMAVITYSMVKDNCIRMSQICVFCYLVLAASQAFIEIVSFFSFIGGRITEQSSTQTVSQSKRVYTTVVESHDLFDGFQGQYYNFQSFVILVTPLIALLGIPLGWLTYRVFPGSVFDRQEGGLLHDNDDAENINRYGGYGTTLGGGANFHPAPRLGSREPSADVSAFTFKGEGQRLGGV